MERTGSGGARRTAVYGSDPPAEDREAARASGETISARSWSEAPPPAGWSGPFSRGEVLGETYEISGVLGAGGMGVVYEAHDLLLDRTVAVKVPLNADYTQSLRKEAQAMAAVHHPNLVAIHAMGHHHDIEYLVMERVVGMTLEDRVDEAWRAGRPIPLEEVLRTLMAVTEALTAIHGAGVAHRDIKSANVMLTGTRVALTDFGLVTAEVAVRSGGPIAGSADYMAPELILGTVQPGQGPLVDIYALGIMAFEVLAGKRPYASERLHAVLAAHLEKPAPDVRSHRRDVPDELALLVRELLAKSPEDRPESSESVLWRLNAIRAGLAGLPEPAPMTVLVVDDDAAECRQLKRSLMWSLPRLSVETAHDGDAALERIERHAPDVVAIDLHLPGMNGVELVMALLSLPGPTRPLLVAMSGDAVEGDLAVLRSLGVNELVAKDERLPARLADVIADLRRSRQAPPTSVYPGHARKSVRPR